MSVVRPTPTATHALEYVEAPGSMLTAAAAKALAVLRISTGFVFLWAFLDKTFGLGYSTPSAKAWINGGSPTKGFLSSVDVGPFQSMFHTMAGTWYANGLFMLAMLAVGIALIAGIGMRIAAGAGVLVLAMMWFAEFPLAQHTASGEASGSSNPIIDYHFVYAVGLVVLALTYAGHTWGLGRRWAQLTFVQKNRWLI
ncbi:thiosulfate dehydrogenase [quinone] large subunit [Actinoplanes tereljensis]|uniref:Membrane protein n=1 Tax=Paractinoplanes tereljensis TaxID=571912 RepID=A0A919NHZ5_9ACTN|nr:DoxX family membrane protein [Actinoplanes tereljensis]GIF18818.1 membrane protein [Actinoplanes tereljensis]